MNTANLLPPLAVVSLTPNGHELAKKLARNRACHCYSSSALMEPGFLPLIGNFSEGIAAIFPRYQALLFICASGIVVRTIAPLLKDKFSDPAVLVMDEQAQHIISLLSGHMGGANRLTRQLAEFFAAEPVITTATDVNQLAALDEIAKDINANIVNFRHSAKLINQLLVSGRRVGLYQQHAQIQDLRGFTLIDEPIQQQYSLDALVWVSMSDQLPALDIPVVQVVPRRVVAGIGCRRGSSEADIYRLLQQQLALYRLHPLALQAIGSINAKQNESGLIQLANKLAVPFHTYSPQQLQPYEHLFSGSLFVRQTVGVSAVSQPVAWLMSGGNLCGDTVKQQGITITLGVNACCMS